jgi:AcrR family transcriptional regulator
MKRNYTKTRRAEQEAETRERIAVAALALHAEIGPARTTISQIAERAGVQRHTVYAHFPEERDLLMACSGLHIAQNPPPSPAGWDTVNDPSVRLKKALTALYGWYAGNEAILAAVLRDAEHHALLREVMDVRFGSAFQAIGSSLSAGLADKGKAALVLAMSFHTWRTLTRDGGLGPTAAADLMAETVRGAA